METKIKLSTTVSLNTEKEADILALTEELRKQHKLGNFISNLLRISMDNPEMLKKAGIDLVNDYGVNINREKFFRAVHRELATMSDKIDAIYDMAVKMYSLSQFNKIMGLESKSVNMLQAQFVLQRQMGELCDVLGVKTLGHTFDSNKVADVTKNAADIMEYIITYYDGIVQEIRQQLVSTNKMISEYMPKTELNMDSKEDRDNTNTVVKVDEQELKKEEVKETEKEGEDDGFADLSELGDLMNFYNSVAN